MSTFVSVGNATQSFSRLLVAIDAISPELPHPIIVQSGNTPFRSNVCEIVPFLDMDAFSRYMMNADLIVTHAGAGSIIHARQCGKLPVVMPRRAAFGEVVDDHQLELAQTLAEAKLIHLANDANELADAVKSALADLRSGAHNPHSAMMQMIGDRLSQLAARIG